MSCLCIITILVSSHRASIPASRDGQGQGEGDGVLVAVVIVKALSRLYADHEQFRTLHVKKMCRHKNKPVPNVHSINYLLMPKINLVHIFLCIFAYFFTFYPCAGQRHKRLHPCRAPSALFPRALSSS